jgi:hypothetical protein
LNRSRCQRITVAGWTIVRAYRHASQRAIKDYPQDAVPDPEARTPIAESTGEDADLAAKGPTTPPRPEAAAARSRACGRAARASRRAGPARPAPGAGRRRRATPQAEPEWQSWLWVLY